MNVASRVHFDLHGVRVAAIYLVCLQHVAHMLPRVVDGLSPGFPDRLRTSLTITGLGAFLVLSGMALSITYRPVRSAQELFQFYRKRCVPHAVTFLTLNLLAFLAAWIVPDLCWNPDSKNRLSMIILDPRATPATVLWYLLFIAEMALAWPLIDKLLPSQNHKLALLAASYLVKYLCLKGLIAVPTWLGLYIGVMVAPYFLWGAALGLARRERVPPLFAVAFITWCLCAFGLHRLAPNFLTAELMALSGTYALIYGVGLAGGMSQKIRRIFGPLAAGAWDVYLLHTPYVVIPVILLIGRLHLTVTQSLIILPIAAALVVALSFGLGRIIRAIPYGSHYILGVSQRRSEPSSYQQA